MKLKVLVVEDDDHLREVLLQAATLEGYSASAASSAEEALNHLQEEHLDILVTDVNLPAMTGLDLLQLNAAIEAAPTGEHGPRREYFYPFCSWCALSVRAPQAKG
jgi:DNA-binding NtrC family response regulator